MLELNKIYNEDCISGMKDIEDKSIDMLLSDLPYGCLECKWDKAIDLTQKPLELFKYLVLTYSNPGDVIFDTCMGAVRQRSRPWRRGGGSWALKRMKGILGRPMNALGRWEYYRERGRLSIKIFERHQDFI